ncbi:hypothetical protein DFH06DRAFT_1153676 [Mycena polygramma]|nr:hypothetical protein DFH06DRAFT_1153676 [Mycena polygramma]
MARRRRRGATIHAQRTATCTMRCHRGLRKADVHSDTASARQRVGYARGLEAYLRPQFVGYGRCAGVKGPPTRRMTRPVVRCSRRFAPTAPPPTGCSYSPRSQLSRCFPLTFPRTPALAVRRKLPGRRMRHGIRRWQGMGATCAACGVLSKTKGEEGGELKRVTKVHRKGRRKAHRQVVRQHAGSCGVAWLWQACNRKQPGPRSRPGSRARAGPRPWCRLFETWLPGDCPRACLCTFLRAFRATSSPEVHGRLPRTLPPVYHEQLLGKESGERYENEGRAREETRTCIPKPVRFYLSSVTRKRRVQARVESSCVRDFSARANGETDMDRAGCVAIFQRSNGRLGFELAMSCAQENAEKSRQRNGETKKCRPAGGLKGGRGRWETSRFNSASRRGRMGWMQRMRQREEVGGRRGSAPFT